MTKAKTRPRHPRARCKSHTQRRASAKRACCKRDFRAFDASLSTPPSASRAKPADGPRFYNARLIAGRVVTDPDNAARERAARAARRERPSAARGLRLLLRICRRPVRPRRSRRVVCGRARRRHRARGLLSQPARDQQPHRLPAEAADARLLGRRRAARRVRRGAAQLRADRRDPEGDAGRRARGRGRALLQAQRRQLRERRSAPAWPTSASPAAPRAHRPSRCRWRAISICRPRRHLLARSTRCCSR